MADLPRVIQTLTDLPEPLRDSLKEFYVPGSDKFSGKLVLAGVDPNVEALQGALQNERTQRATAISDVTSARTRVTELETEMDKLKRELGSAKKNGHKAPDDELVEQLKNLQETTGSQIKALQEQVQTERDARLNAEMTMRTQGHETAMRKAAIAGGASERTADDVVNRMRPLMKEKDGHFVPHKEDGTILLGRENNPTEPMSFEEVARGIIGQNPHLKKGSAGGGSGGGAEAPGVQGRFVLTKSEAKDPAVYRRMRDEAAKVGQFVEIVEDRII